MKYLREALQPLEKNLQGIDQANVIQILAYVQKIETLCIDYSKVGVIEHPKILNLIDNYLLELFSGIDEKTILANFKTLPCPYNSKLAQQKWNTKINEFANQIKGEILKIDDVASTIESLPEIVGQFSKRHTKSELPQTYSANFLSGYRKFFDGERLVIIRNPFRTSVPKAYQPTVDEYIHYQQEQSIKKFEF